MSQQIQVVKELRNCHIVDVLEPDQKVAKNAKEIKVGTGTQSLKQKVRLDVVPVFMDGSEAQGNDPTVNSEAFKKDDNKSPIIEWRWLIDGREASNSAQMADPFHFGSYEDNGGCTPTLKLETQVGGGRHLVTCHAFVRAEWNGGVPVQSKAVSWYCD